MSLFLQKFTRNFVILILLALTFVLGQACNMVMENSLGKYFEKKDHKLLYSFLYFLTIVFIMFGVTYAVSGDIDNLSTFIR